jgi:hypothetical protein
MVFVHSWIMSGMVFVHSWIMSGMVFVHSFMTMKRFSLRAQVSEANISMLVYSYSTPCRSLQCVGNMKMSFVESR